MCIRDRNTTGVRDILELSPQFLKEQLDCIFTDIRPDAVKIGMVSSTELIEVIAGSLRQYEAAHIVEMCIRDRFLLAYMQYGPEFVQKINGVFGAVIWDETKKILFFIPSRLNTLS